MAELNFMKLDIYIMAPETISTAYFISSPPVCIYVYLSIVARQRLGKNVAEATNIHTTEELLDASFFMRSVWQRRKFFPELLVPILFSQLQYTVHTAVPFLCTDT
jgi:hypothetical protein